MIFFLGFICCIFIPVIHPSEVTMEWGEGGEGDEGGGVRLRVERV